MTLIRNRKLRTPNPKPQTANPKPPNPKPPNQPPCSGGVKLGDFGVSKLAESTDVMTTFVGVMRDGDGDVDVDGGCGVDDDDGNDDASDCGDA